MNDFNKQTDLSEFDASEYERLLQGGGKLTEKEVGALIVHLEKLLATSTSMAGQTFFSDAEVMNENRHKILKKAQEIHAKIAEMLKALLSVDFETEEEIEARKRKEEEERKKRQNAADNFRMK